MVVQLSVSVEFVDTFGKSELPLTVTVAVEVQPFEGSVMVTV